MFIDYNSRAFLNEDLARFKLLSLEMFGKKMQHLFFLEWYARKSSWNGLRSEILFACLDLRICGDLEKDSVSRKYKWIQTVSSVNAWISILS